MERDVRKLAGDSPDERAKCRSTRGGVPWWVGPAIAALGVALMAVGIWRGEMLVVFRKAVAICLECIGIG